MEQKTVKTSKGVAFYMRKWHRILGYLAVGMVIVYALSGIVLIHRSNGFMRHTVAVEQTVAPNLKSDELGGVLKIKHFKVVEETPETIIFNSGSYDKATGVASYTKQELVAPLNKFAALHLLSDKQNPHIAWFTTLFGIVLFLLAFTALFMYKTSAKVFRANMIYTLIGVAITIILLLAL